MKGRAAGNLEGEKIAAVKHRVSFSVQLEGGVTEGKNLYLVRERGGT